MSETKKQLLSRKNAQLWTTQARIKSIKVKLDPLSRMSNATQAVKEIMELCDIAMSQIDRFTLHEGRS